MPVTLSIDSWSFMILVLLPRQTIHVTLTWIAQVIRPCDFLGWFVWAITICCLALALQKQSHISRCPQNCAFSNPKILHSIMESGILGLGNAQFFPVPSLVCYSTTSHTQPKILILTIVWALLFRRCCLCYCWQHLSFRVIFICCCCNVEGQCE